MAHPKLVPLIEAFNAKSSGPEAEHALGVALAIIGDQDHNGKHYEATTPEGDKVRELKLGDQRDPAVNIAEQVLPGTIKVKVSKLEAPAKEPKAEKHPQPLRGLDEPPAE
jgi:hypothetical protein